MTWRLAAHDLVLGGTAPHIPPSAPAAFPLVRALLDCLGEFAALATVQKSRSDIRSLRTNPRGRHSSEGALVLLRVRFLRSDSAMAAVSVAMMIDNDRYVLRWNQWAAAILTPTNTRMPPSAWDR